MYFWVCAAVLVISSYIIGKGIGRQEGYDNAHLVIAKECRLLGKFYVGDTVYECVKIGEEKDNGSANS